MSTSNQTALLINLQNQDAGGCPVPFISESLHPFNGGFLAGRNCAENPLVTTGNASRCCIPCPVYDWTYRADFKRLTDGAAWVNVVGFILCSILLIAMTIQRLAYHRTMPPDQRPKKGSINYVILVSIMILELGFIIPLARQPEQCFDPVTPNGQASDLTCAFSGAFLAFGLMSFVVAILLHSLFMFLQICLDWKPKRVHEIAAAVAASAIIISLTAATLAHTGVSYRFGGYCHINVRSLATYWGWLFGFGGTACLLQIATMIFCVKVFLSSEWNSRVASAISHSSRTQKLRDQVKRVRKALLLQWRSLTLAFLAVFTTAFVCIVFMIYDNNLTIEAFNNVDTLIPWILCLIETQSVDQCIRLTGPIILPEDLAVAALFILAFLGVEAFFLMARKDTFTEWHAVFIKYSEKLRGRRKRPAFDPSQDHADTTSESKTSAEEQPGTASQGQRV